MPEQMYRESLSTVVVNAVARREGINPADLEEPLYKSINPEALDDLFNGGDGYVAFSYHGYLITIRSDGHIASIDPVMD